MEAHSDSSVLSVINQEDAVGSLHVLYGNAWRDVVPVGAGEAGTLLVNLGAVDSALRRPRIRAVCAAVRGVFTRERHLCFHIFNDLPLCTSTATAVATDHGSGRQRQSARP